MGLFDAVHQLGCLHTSRDGFIGESLTGMGDSGEQVCVFTTLDVENPSEVSDPHRRFLVVNQPLEEMSTFLLAGLALHQARAVVWQGTRIVPAGEDGLVLPAICTVGVVRGAGGNEYGRMSLVRSYGRSGVQISDEPVEMSRGDSVVSMRDAQMQRIARWVASLVPGLDVAPSE